MNILISSVTSNYSDEWISRLLSKLDINECIAVFANGDISEKGVVASRFATMKLNREKLKKGDYNHVKEIMTEAPPVDEALLDSVAKYEKQLFCMMERTQTVEYNHRWWIYIQHLRFWSYVLDRYNIDVFFTPCTTHESYDYVIYILCKVKGIRIVTGFPAAYYNRIYVFNDIYDQLPDFEKNYTKLLKRYENSDIKNIILKPHIDEMFNFYTGKGDRTPFYMKPSEPIFNSNIEKYLYKNYSLIRKLIKIKHRDTSLPCTRYIWRLFYRVYFTIHAVLKLFSFSIDTYKWFEERLYGTKVFHEDDIALDYYQNNTVAVDYKKKYVYVALHMQPENTSSPLGGIFVDQALMIEMLSYHLPQGWILYVKEHPSQVEESFRLATSYRALRFYERIKACPNVEFVPLQENTYDLISNAKAVATLTGTAGLEAITQGIPCFMFGYSYVQYAPNVFHIKNNEDCKKAFETIGNDCIDKDYYKKMKIYFKTLEKYIFEGTTEYYLLTVEEQPKAQDALVSHFRELIISRDIDDDQL
ncbi:hypothetical protein [Selenomonas sp. FC4001]|uniref:hypothetical protein n=1 Tax=Selenomonas sp. FC4001 TaxID=1408313 RepID=UPI00055CF62C|nr:hypothetical protein [Selenomonas sp. FC4001]